jgi:6-phospho-3-hexuloisomerase
VLKDTDTNPWKAEADTALAEVAAAVDTLDPAALDRLVEELCSAGVIACHGLGREGLGMRGLAMRLFHAGLPVHVVGDMTTPPVGDGDLLLVSSGPGSTSSVQAIARAAKRGGARLVVFTAEPDAPPADLADLVVELRAQTMSSDSGSEAVLPMGSGFELALFLLGDLVTNAVRRRRGETLEDIRARHTNLE